MLNRKNTHKYSKKHKIKPIKAKFKFKKKRLITSKHVQLIRLKVSSF